MSTSSGTIDCQSTWSHFPNISFFREDIFCCREIFSLASRSISCSNSRSFLFKFCKLNVKTSLSTYVLCMLIECRHDTLKMRKELCLHHHDVPTILCLDCFINPCKSIRYLFLIPLLTFAVTNNSLHENYRLEMLHRVIKTVCTRYYNCYEQTWYFSSLLYKIYKFIIKNAWVNVFSVWWKNVVLFAMQMKIRKQVWPIVNTWNHWKVFLTWQLNQPRPARKHEILLLLLPHHTIQTVSGACGIFFSCVVLWCGKTLNKTTTLTANRYLNSVKIQQVSLFLGWGSSCPSRMIFFPGVA